MAGAAYDVGPSGPVLGRGCSCRCGIVPIRGGPCLVAYNR